MPDIISTDMHTLTYEGPCYDLPTAMTRVLHLGMPLETVIRCSTIAPAQAIGWDDRIGTLGTGREADVTVLEVADVDMDLEDCQGQMRRVDRRLVARAAWRAGDPVVITEPRLFPNLAQVEEISKFLPMLVVRDT